MRNIIPGILTIYLSFFFVLSVRAEEKSLPTVVELGSISRQYEPVTFNHEMHVTAAGGAANCSACHHQHPSIKNLSCKDCHAINSAEYQRAVIHTFLPCRSCHDAYNISNPGVPNLQVAYHRTCFKCHWGMGNIGIDPKGCTEICHTRKSEIMFKNRPPMQQ
jgi:hypothetical protein